MNLTDLRDLFSETFQQPLLRKPLSRVPDAPKADNSYIHLFYPIKALPELINMISNLDIRDGYHNKFSVRYIVLPRGEIFFSREGKPGHDIPAHRAMGSKCLAAGNIYFSDDYQFITKINHQSGDFHSTQGSLVWPLAAILLTNTAISNPFKLDISHTNASGEFETETLFELTPEELLDLLPEGISERILPANLDATIRFDEFEPSKKRKHIGFFNHPDTAKMRRVTLPVVVNGANTPPSSP